MRVPASLHKRMKIHVALTGQDVKSIIIELVENTLDGKEEGYRKVTKGNNLVYNLSRLQNLPTNSKKYTKGAPGQYFC